MQISALISQTQRVHLFISLFHLIFELTFNKPKQFYPYCHHRSIVFKPSSDMTSIQLAKRCLIQISRRQICTTNILNRSHKVNLFDLNFDRRVKVDYVTSIKYMDSQAYKKTYQGHLVWKLYKRNHKAQFPRDQARPTCINEENFLDTSYPCPICRDEYLVLHPENIKLLEQFIDPYTGKLYTPKDHGLCQRQYRNLVIAIEQAKDIGTLTYEIPERLYNYDLYYKKDDCNQ